MLGGNLQQLACDFRVTSWSKADAFLGRHPKVMGYSDGCHGKAGEVTRVASAKRAGTWRRKVNLGAERRIGGWLRSQLIWKTDETNSQSLSWMTCNVAGQLKKSRSLWGMDKGGEMNAGNCCSVGFATVKAGWSEAVVNYYNLNEHTAAFPSLELFSPSKTTKNHNRSKAE